MSKKKQTGTLQPVDTSELEHFKAAAAAFLKQLAGYKDPYMVDIRKELEAEIADQIEWGEKGEVD